MDIYHNAETIHQHNVYDPQRWGLPVEAVSTLSKRLHAFWRRFRRDFKTHTRDTSECAYDYLRGQLTMDTTRNFASIARHTTGDDGQALQHFMSQSPWSGQTVFTQIQDEIKATEALSQGGTLILDESADEKAGPDSAGASRQYNGRLGKVDLCQVSTCLLYANGRVWAMVDGELFLPDEWFDEEQAHKRNTLGIPKERQFQKKADLGLPMVKRAKANGVPFELLACDAFYGRDSQFRADVEAENVPYAAQVPSDTRVYVSQPQVEVPKKRGKRGRPPHRLKVLSRHTPREVRQLARNPNTQWERVRVRLTERGWLEADFAVKRVWTVAEGQRPRAEWLVIRRDPEGDHAYTLLNGGQEARKEELIARSCRRYFAERIFEDGKTEMGWDEFQAQKYRAWEHHVALTALALWFVAQTKLEWEQSARRDPELAQQLEVELLPALSTANIRELLKAVLPLPRLTPTQATALVIEHLVNRARSTKSRSKSQLKAHDSS